jgi:hypothetical protein
MAEKCIAVLLIDGVCGGAECINIFGALELGNWPPRRNCTARAGRRTFNATLTVSIYAVDHYLLYMYICRMSTTR